MLRRIALLAAAGLLTVSLRAAELREVSSAAQISHKPAAGKVLVVNIWATWCVPCVHEMDDLRRLHTSLRDRGVEFVGVSMDDVLPGDRVNTKTKVAGFLAGKMIRYPNLYYTGKQDALAEAFRFEGEIPVTLVFDRSGREVLRMQGAIDRRFGERLKALSGKR